MAEIAGAVKFTGPGRQILGTWECKIPSLLAGKGSEFWGPDLAGSLKGDLGQMRGKGIGFGYGWWHLIPLLTAWGALQVPEI